LYAVALILLAYLLYQYTRLRARARELRRKEIQLIQANKMTALGTLVSGVAHEINNPNQVVLMNAEVMARAWDDTLDILDSHHAAERFSLAELANVEARATLSPLLREIAEGARRIQTILNDLKDFARPAAQASETFSLNDVVHRALRLLAHVIRKRTDVFEVRLANELPCLHGNPQQVGQVVVNLMNKTVNFEWLEATPSAFVHVPGGAKHAFRNISGEPVLQLVTTTPELGWFFEEIGRPVVFRTNSAAAAAR
jgi:signal transduction histidine kinase